MQIKNLIKSTSFVLTAKVLNSIFSFVSFVLISRALPVADLGIYIFILSASAIVCVMSNWGTNEYLFRRGAANTKVIPKTLKAAGTTRLILGLIFGFFATVILATTRNDPSFLLLFPLGLLITMTDAQTIAYIMSFRAQDNMKFEGKLYTGRGIIKLTLISIVTLTYPTLPTIFFALIFTNISGLLYAIYINRRDYTEYKQKLSFRYLKPFTLLSTPYLLMSALGTFNAQIDILMLGIMTNDIQVGIYSVAFQIFTTLIFIPTSFNIAIQPLLVRTHKKNTAAWFRQIKKLFTYILIPALLASVFLSYFMPYILPMIFGDKFTPSNAITYILMYAFGFRIIWITVISTSFISANIVIQLNKLIFTGLIIHIILNFILITRMGPIGAAYSMLITEALLVVLGLTLLYIKKKNHSLS